MTYIDIQMTFIILVMKGMLTVRGDIMKLDTMMGIKMNITIKDMYRPDRSIL